MHPLLVQCCRVFKVTKEIKFNIILFLKIQAIVNIYKKEGRLIHNQSKRFRILNRISERVLDKPKTKIITNNKMRLN